VKRTLYRSIVNYPTLILLTVITLCLSACGQTEVFEKNKAIPKYKWQYDLRPTFEFNITDTSTLYNLYVVLRHTDAYGYNNIWLNIGTQSPGDSMRYQRFDLQLGNDATGWEGTGMDDIWEVRKAITRGPTKFNKAGTYKFSVAQIMRENPLDNIISVGIRVERINDLR
jgi:gliding motility-associated lipoprotein GldH